MSADHLSDDGMLSRSKSWMLGPKADNEAVFERLLLETLRDHCSWRRNFHPQDAAHVRAADRLSPPFQEQVEVLHDRLFEMLSHLKRSSLSSARAISGTCRRTC